MFVSSNMFLRNARAAQRALAGAELLCSATGAWSRGSARQLLTGHRYADVVQPTRRLDSSSLRSSPPADRSVASLVARGAWLVFGALLLAFARWPPSCIPAGWADVIGVYRCSLRLGEQRGWIEAALLTWLWATPILASMAVLRRLR